MAKYVQEIVNPQLFFLGPLAPLSTARDCMILLGIGGVPILDGEGRPIGFVAMREVVSGERGTVQRHMSTPAVTIPNSATIEQAGKILADTGLHRLVVVDEDGRCVGIVSSLDVIRGLLGTPIDFPDEFHHRDPVTGLEWRGDFEMLEEKAASTPAAPGLIVLRYGRPGLPEVPIWVGMAENLRETLLFMLRDPKAVDPLLAQWMKYEAPHIRFRTAMVSDEAKRRRALEELHAATKVRAWAREIVPTPS